MAYKIYHMQIAVPLSCIVNFVQITRNPVNQNALLVLLNCSHSNAKFG